MTNLTILISGNGSNMKAIVAACDDGRLDARVTTVISSQKAINFQLMKGWCKTRGIDCYHNRKDFYATSAEWESVLSSLIGMSDPDLVCLAGYMTVLPPGIVSRFKGRIVNIHPSLLPKYPGLNTHARVLASDDVEHGATVHYVIAELDAGPIIGQVAVYVDVNDTEETLRDRVRATEHDLYISSIALIIDEGVDNHYKICFNAAIPDTLRQFLDTSQTTT